MKALNHPGSAVVTTLFLMFGMMTMAMIAIDIITSSLQRQRAEGASLKAFYAAEAGIEWSALQFKLNGHGQALDLFDQCRANSAQYFHFLPCGDEEVYNFDLFDNPNLPKYSVKFDIQNTGLINQVTLNSRGSFQGTNRELQVFFCVPHCGIGDTVDGCGGDCF